MILADKYAASNRLASVHFPEKALLVTVMAFAAFFSENPATLLCVPAILLGILVKRAEIPFRFLAKVLLLPLFFVVPGILAIAVQPTAPESAVWGVSLSGHFLGVTPEALEKAQTLFLRVYAAISCFYFLILTTPLTDMLLFLNKLRVPELFLELTSMTYRFIFLVLDTSERIRLSQEARLGSATLRSRFRSVATLMANLFLITLKRSDQHYVAMESRCYDGSFRLLARETRFSMTNLTAILLVALLLAAVEAFSGGLP